MSEQESHASETENSLYDRLHELELRQAQHDFETKLAHEEGRRAGVNFMITVIAFGLTLLLAIGITTLWNTTQEFQKTTNANIKATLEPQVSKLSTESEATIESLVTTIVYQENMRATEISVNINEHLVEIEATNDIHITELSETAAARHQMIIDRGDEINQSVSTRIYGTLEAKMEESAVATVMFEIIETKANGMIQEAVSRSVRATTTAMPTPTPVTSITVKGSPEPTPRPPKAISTQMP